MDSPGFTTEFSTERWTGDTLRATRSDFTSLQPCHAELAADPAAKLPRSQPANGSARRLALATLVVALAFAGGIALLPSLRPPNAPPPAPAMVDIAIEPPPTTLPPPAPASEAAPPVPPPAATTTTAPAAPAATVPARPVPATPRPPPVKRAPSPDAASRRPAAPPSAPAARPETAPSPQPPRPAPPNAGEIAAFQASMRRAVREALIYPSAARMAGQTGEVRIGFDYMDGTASNVAAASSSGLPLLDRAAIATVVAAHLPLPPPEMAHRTLHLTIAVQFDPKLSQ